MFANISNNLISPIVLKTDAEKTKKIVNPDIGEAVNNTASQKFVEDSLMDLRDVQEFLFSMIGAKIKEEKGKLTHNRGVNFLV